MMPKLAWRFLTEPDKRLLRTFVVNMGLKGARSMALHERRLRHGEFFPPFVFISLTNNCNLKCRGCWVSRNGEASEMPLEMAASIIESSRAMGCSFFGLLGGEPTMYRGLFDLVARFPGCYFQVFTNGTLLDESAAARMRELGNMTPLVSVEGTEVVSDERRGGSGVYSKAMAALDACRSQKLITGVATSVCASNYDDLVSDRFLEGLVRRGVLYAWYYIYRPVGPDPAPELVLDRARIDRLRRFMVEARLKHPIVIVDAYWDHLGRAICPAAAGISHHINPAGDIEPCPPIQFARDNVADGDLCKVFDHSAFLRAFRAEAASKRGCILLEDPERLRAFLLSQNARDTTGRGTGWDELAAAKPEPGHDMQGSEIPEKSLFYRMAKKRWFFGFGAYG